MPLSPAVNIPSLASRLADGVAALGLDVTADVQARLLAFVELLEKWNRSYNLTAVRDPEQMIARHILDSLAVAPYVHGTRAADLGSGAGLPGIPLALVAPQREFVLLDSNAKKTRFITEAVGALNIKNVTVVQERAEKYRPAQPFDTVIARAFASIGEFIACAEHLCRDDGRFLAMKGVYPAEELAAIPAGYRAESVAALSVPGLDAARHLAIIVRA